jgi:hypothetical protein
VLLTLSNRSKASHSFIPTNCSNPTQLLRLKAVEVTDSHLHPLSQIASHKTEHNARAPPIGTGFDLDGKRGGPGYRVHLHQTQWLFRSQTLE